MEKLKLFMIMLVLGGLGLVGCDDNDPEGPEISATTFVAGSEPGTAELRVPEGAEVVYRFDIKSAAPISKIEVWYRPGLGANMEAPMEEQTIELYGVSEYVVSDTLTLDEDCSYSVYVEDVNRNFSSARVNLYLDVTKYNVELTDGMPAATSKTFLCLETGRTFYVANIANDPKGIDLGFTYYEGNDNKACLVSLDEYYKTGNYAMVVNDLNPEVIFKDATDLVTKESVFDQVNKASDLKDIFDQAKDYPTVLDYTAGKIAPALEEEDMIAFRTEDGRYGLMKVKEIDRKNEDVSNNQTISLDVVVEKN